MNVEYEWDGEKAAANLNKHGVAFDEARTVFEDPLADVVPDLAHSEDETRFVGLGTSAASRLLVVVFTERENRIRIISAREATPKERKHYGTYSDNP